MLVYLLEPWSKGLIPSRDAFWLMCSMRLRLLSLRELVAEGNHFAEFPGGVDVQEREGDAAGMEGLLGEADHDGGVFADGVEHDGVGKFCGDFADDVDGLGFKLLEVGEGIRGGFGGGHQKSPEWRKFLSIGGLKVQCKVKACLTGRKSICMKSRAAALQFRRVFASVLLAITRRFLLAADAAGFFSRPWRWRR